MRGESQGEDAEVRSESLAVAARVAIPVVWVGQVMRFKGDGSSSMHCQGALNKWSSRYMLPVPTSVPGTMFVEERKEGHPVGMEPA